MVEQVKIQLVWGLYIVKKLCEKLGHQVTIKSKEKEFTCVKISFLKNDYYNVTKKRG